ncbi:MAG: hypothetical protein WBA91_08685 [Paracoccaceae bacterium]
MSNSCTQLIGCLARAGLVLALLSPAARAEAPLSIIDWLSESVATPTALPNSALPGHPPTPGSETGIITVRPLGDIAPVSLGLISAQRAGLPKNLWGNSASADLARLLAEEAPDTLPAVRNLLYSVLTAELLPPVDGDGQSALFLARVDKLLDLGALDTALGLLEQLKDPAPEAFRRWFDVSLLLGHENYACEVMDRSPDVAPTFPARIFCLARLGDWNAAALSLRTGRTLGTIDAEMADLLERFLDPDYSDGAPPLPPLSHLTPLSLRMMEAIGEPVPTATLPLAFAQADLRSNTGWKARIEAGERLARTGAIPPNRLLGLYSERKAAASGGVWERVKAVQAFDTALRTSDPDQIGAKLRPVWEQMVGQELEVPFATIYGPRLVALDLEGEAGALAFRIGLLSGDYEKAAHRHKASNREEAFLAGLATGSVGGTVPTDQLGVAVSAAFTEGALPDENAQRLLDEGKVGEALLNAIAQVTEGARGDLRQITSGLVLLRHIGMESVARRAALELTLLERRG